MRKDYRLSDGKLLPIEEPGGDITVFIAPDEAEKRYLVNELKVDEHTLNSALDPDELSRLEFEPEHAALIFKRPKNYSALDKFMFKVSSLGLFLFRDKLVVLLTEDIPLFEGRLFQRDLTPTRVLLRLLSRCITHFIEHLRIINMISDSLEAKINASMENKYLLNLFVLEKSLVYYLNAINSNGTVLERIRNSSAKFGLDPDSLEFLDDTLIENNQCYKQAEIYSNILSSLMDARASIVGNNLNVLMKTLNIITIGIMVPTFVVSLFSMNVHIPGEAHPMAFWFIIGLAAAAVGGFMFFWKTRKWY